MKSSRILKGVINTICLLGIVSHCICQPSELSSLGLHVIPYPQQVELGGADFLLQNDLTIVLDENASNIDRKTAEQLKLELKEKWGIAATTSDNKGACNILLTRLGVPKEIVNQGYDLATTKDILIIKAKDEDGLFYGVQTLSQVIKKARGEIVVPGMQITDWPDVKIRAVHYDTKHHQDKASYVKDFIRDMARFKINMLVWEWEDKLAYKSHPEIGAPGAFTIEEMQEFTRLAREYHIELTPLVQGLGHVSFILKWPQYKDLREVADSDWEFCPLEEGTYDLLFDLWDEAIEATPGSKYIHIGSDETFELGLCDKCQTEARDIGNSGLYHLFAKRASGHLKTRRKVMLWERPMGWEMNKSRIKNMKPDEDLVLTESYNYETPDFKYAKEAKDMGFELFIYDPNPGLEPLALPYHYKLRKGNKAAGSLKNSYERLTSASRSQLFDGMINTSWDDSGLHNQMWMLSFATSAEYSWNASAPGLDEFENSFFLNYYGNNVVDMQELYELLNEGSYYYAHTMERNVWHHGEIGKTHLPDLPRGQYIEYDPYWNTEYKEVVLKSKKELNQMKRAMQIIEGNKKLASYHIYDFELYQSMADLIDHTCQTYLDLSQLEQTMRTAHLYAFSDRKAALTTLQKAEEILENSLARRQNVYDSIVSVWEQSRLPKGYSTPDKKYFYKMDRSRHFANRTPDLSYLIYDEQLLDMEGYLEKLIEYIKSFQLEF